MHLRGRVKKPEIEPAPWITKRQLKARLFLYGCYLILCGSISWAALTLIKIFS
jgi:hypothetical protein